MSITYASDHVIEGKIVQDTITTATGTKLQAKGFKFLVEEELNKLIVRISHNSGVLGLSPEDQSAGPLLVSALHEQG